MSGYRERFSRSKDVYIRGYSLARRVESNNVLTLKSQSWMACVGYGTTSRGCIWFRLLWCSCFHRMYPFSLLYTRMLALNISIKVNNRLEAWEADKWEAKSSNKSAFQYFCICMNNNLGVIENHINLEALKPKIGCDSNFHELREGG